MMKKIFAVLVFAFVALFGGVASAQQPKGDGDDEFCQKMADCESKKPPPPPPRFKCGKGTAEEGQILVGKMCTCAKTYRSVHLVHDLQAPGTLVCVPGVEILERFDALEARVATTETELATLKAEWVKFREWIAGLNLEEFIYKTNKHLKEIDDRLDELERWRKNVVDPKLAEHDEHLKEIDDRLDSAVQFTLGVEGGGGVRTASDGDKSFTEGNGYFVGRVGIEGYFTDVFGLAAKLKAGLVSGSETRGVAALVGGAAQLAFRVDHIGYVKAGPAVYEFMTSHDGPDGKDNSIGYTIGAELDGGVRPIPEVEIGASVMIGGGHNASAEVPIEGLGLGFMGGLYVQGNLGI